MGRKGRGWRRLVIDVATDDRVIEFVDAFVEEGAVGLVFDDVAFVFAGEGEELGVDVRGGHHDAVGVADSRLGEGHVVEVFEHAEVFGCSAVGFEFAFHIGAEATFEGVVGERENRLGAGEEGVFLVDASQVEGDHAREPAGEMDEVRLPSQFSHGFEGAASEEEDAFVVVGIEFTIFVEEAFVVGEIFLVVDEVDLHACRGDRADLDDELVVGVVDDKVHAREADDLMELVFAFVNIAETRHENSNFASFFLSVGR